MSEWLASRLTVRALELFHERYNRFDTGQRERILDRRSNARY